MRGAVHLRDEGGDAAGDLTRDEHRDVVRGRQQDRHERIPLGELLAGADIDDRLTLAAPRLGVRDIALTDHESPAAVARVQRVVLEHEVGGHHLCHAGDRDRLLVRAHRRPAVAEHVRPLSAPRPPVRRQVPAIRAVEQGAAVLVVEQVAGCRERRGGEEQGEHRAEQHAATAPAVHGYRPVARPRRLAHAAQAKPTRMVDRVRRAAVRAGCLSVMPPFQAARCCQHVCDFRYADDMRQLVASERACVDRRGRAVHGRSDPRWPTPGGDRGRHRR